MKLTPSYKKYSVNYFNRIAKKEKGNAESQGKQMDSFGGCSRCLPAIIKYLLM